MAEAPQPDPKERPDSPGTVLDSVFRADGPLPPAGLGLRTLAFAMDFILLSILSAFISWQWIIPQSYPEAWNEFRAFTEAFVAWMQAGDGTAAPEPSHNLSRALVLASEIQVIVFWVYFAAGEAFFHGSSLGKRTCRIRSVSTVTLGPLPVFAGLVRGGLKTVCIFFWLGVLPIGLIATWCGLFFNRRRQLGHDLLSRSAVVDERSMQMKNS